MADVFTLATAVATAVTVTAPAAQKARVLLLPVEIEADAKPPILDAVESELSQLDPRGMEVLSLREINALLRAERVRDVVGCRDEECMASISAAANIDQVLLGRLTVAADGFTLIISHLDARTARLIRRRAFGRLRAQSLSHLAREVSAWLSGRAISPLVEPKLQLVVEGEAEVGRLLAERVTGELASFGLVVQRAGVVTDRVVVTVHSCTVIERRHHIHRYLDGNLVATLRIERLPAQAALFVESASVSESKRARYASREAVVAALVEQAVARWMNSFRAAGVAARLTRREP